MVKPGNTERLQILVAEGRLSMTAFDEAHLFHQWQEFRPAYKELEKLKSEFPMTPICVWEQLFHLQLKRVFKQPLRYPLLSKASTDRPNVYLETKCHMKQNLNTLHHVFLKCYQRHHLHWLHWFCRSYNESPRLIWAWFSGILWWHKCKITQRELPKVEKWRCTYNGGYLGFWYGSERS